MRNSATIAFSIAAAIVALAAWMAPCTASAQSYRGEKTLGVRAGYVSRNTSPSAGIYFEYRFSRHFRLAPNIVYAFRNDGTDAFFFNVDTHYPVALGSTRTEFYPIAGVSVAAWNSKHPLTEQGDVTSRATRLGLNAGAGISYKVTPTLKLSLEGRYNCVKGYSTGLFSLGIGYCF